MNLAIIAPVNDLEKLFEKNPRFKKGFGSFVSTRLPTQRSMNIVQITHSRYTDIACVSKELNGNQGAVGLYVVKTCRYS